MRIGTKQSKANPGVKTKYKRCVYKAKMQEMQTCRNKQQKVNKNSHTTVERQQRHEQCKSACAAIQPITKHARGAYPPRHVQATLQIDTSHVSLKVRRQQRAV